MISSNGLITGGQITSGSITADSVTIPKPSNPIWVDANNIVHIGENYSIPLSEYATCIKILRKMTIAEYPEEFL
jgi:hypothetical protein